MTNSPPLSQEFKAPRSIIVLTREHLGDLVCTTPALRSLRRLYPDAHIVVEVGERAACILQNNPNVDEIILRPRHQGVSGKAAFIRLLRRRGFDLGVILDGSSDMRLYLWLGGVRRRVGIVRKKRFARMLTDQVLYDNNAHDMIDNFRNVVGHLGGDISDSSPELYITARDVQAVDQMFATAGISAEETLIAFNPGTSTPPRQWPPERFAELGCRLAANPNTRILLLGGPNEKLLVESIAADMSIAPTVLKNITVMEQVEVQRRCALLVTGNTGPMHMACATGTPIVAVFGPTDPRESGPNYVPGNITIRKTDGCRDCCWERCVHANQCMRAISAEEVADAVTAMLRGNGKLI